MAEKVFTLFHFSLVPIRQTTITMRSQDSREDWLRYALKEPFEFLHRGGAKLYWVPKDDVGECILGLIQRTRSHVHHRSPADGGGEVVDQEWQGSFVLIDPTHHDSGQRVAVENDVVGAPKALLKSLIFELNRRLEAPYQIEFEPLFDASQFWQFASKHHNVLKRITFDFVVPNMWGTETDLEQDLKETGLQTGAERVVVTLAGEHGVATNNAKVREGVSYAEKGAGTVRATAPDGTRFSSDRRPTITKIPAIQAGTDTVMAYFAHLKRRILGHGQADPMDGTDRSYDGPAVD